MWAYESVCVCTKKCVHTNVCVRGSELQGIERASLALGGQANQENKVLGHVPALSAQVHAAGTINFVYLHYFPLTDLYLGLAERVTKLGSCLCCVCNFLSVLFCMAFHVYCQCFCGCLLGNVCSALTLACSGTEYCRAFPSTVLPESAKL